MKNFTTYYILLYKILVLCLLFLVPFGEMCTKICRNCTVRKKLTFTEYMFGYLPIVNIPYTLKALYGKSTKTIIANSIAVVLIIINIIFEIINLNVYNSIILFSVKLAAMALPIIILYMTYTIDIYKLCTTFRCNRTKYLSVIPPLAALLLSFTVDKYFKENKEIVDGTFIE